MIQKLNLISMITITLLLTGCGGGGNSEKSITEQISERDAVLIIHDANLAFCETLKELFLQEGSPAKDVIIDNPDNSVNCSTYNKVESDFYDDHAECANISLAYFLEDESDDVSLYDAYEDTSKACVIGANEK